MSGQMYHSDLPSVPPNPPTNRKTPPDNKSSLLLTPEENQTIFEILGKGRQTLSTAVVQLLVPTPDQQQWQKKETGVVCFVRDQTKKSYFIQVLSLRTRNMVFRQEIYNQFEYQMRHQFFLTFEGDNSMVGINFADVAEASGFKEVLDNKLEMKRQRRNERRSRLMELHQNPHVPQNNNNNPTYVPPKATTMVSNGAPLTSGIRIGNKFNAKPGKGGRGKDKKKGLRKEDIGTPMDFRHVQHVGWDPNKGYDLDVHDKDFQTFFEKVGVSHNQLEDVETRQFIYNFIEKHGGREAVKNEISSAGRAPAPPPAPNHGVSNPPPVPTRHPMTQTGTNKPVAPPPPPSRPVPPPPPPTYNQTQAPPPPPSRTTSHPQFPRGPSIQPAPPPPNRMEEIYNYQSPMKPPPPPDSPVNVPPPPPPPPPMPTSTNLHQPAVNASSNYPDDSDSGFSERNAPNERSNLLKQIQEGVSLKRVSPEMQPKKPSATISDCLNQIKIGVDLKPVPETTKQSPNIDGMDGLAGALARALAERNRAMNPSDSDSSGTEDGEEFEEDEWD